MSENELWRELVACILGSRVRFEVAYSAMQRMDARLLFCEPRRSSHFERYEQDVIAALSEGCAAGGSNRYPFFRTRANQIRRAAERLYGRCGTIRSFLKGSHDIRDIRRKLALEVSGLGPKQASLFLRNIGYTADIAVLDIHILTYMAWLGLTETPIRTVPTVQRYEILEKIFIEHAYSLGYPPEHFDLAIWVVVKVARREQRTWG
jgi:N-glycosylase/DNA lyase